MKKRADGRYLKQIRINGKTKSFYGKSENEINKKILAFKVTAEKGEYLKTVAKAWEAEYLQSVPYTTYKKCGQSAYNMITDTYGERRITDIKPYDINVFLQRLAARGYAQKTVAAYKSIFNQIFKFAIINNYAENNPVQNVPLPKHLSKTTRTLPPSEELKIIDGLHDGFGFLAYFLMYTGLRKSEALALEYGDIDYKNKLISVNKKIVYDGNTPMLVRKTKTAAGTRQVILLDRVSELLPNKKNGIIFCNENGGYLTRKQFRCRWSKMKKENNLTVTAHQLRHAYATMLFEAGIKEKDAQELMGHSDIRLTQSVYTHIRQERKTETAEKLNCFNF